MKKRKDDPKPAKLSVCMEAEGLTNGDRRVAYGHPMDNFGRTVKMVNAFLNDKLKAPITEEEWGLINVIAKVSRSANRMKRDNVTDIAGYANTVGMVMDRREETNVGPHCREQGCNGQGCSCNCAVCLGWSSAKCRVGER